MQIKQPENIDQLFKDKLEHIPVEFNEAHWSKLNSLLDSTVVAKPVATKVKSAVAKWLYGATAFLAVLATVYFMNKEKSSSNGYTPPINQAIKTKQKDSVVTTTPTINLFVTIDSSSLDKQKTRKERFQPLPKAGSIKLLDSANALNMGPETTKKDTLKTKHIFW